MGFDRTDDQWLKNLVVQLLQTCTTIIMLGKILYKRRNDVQV